MNMVNDFNDSRSSGRKQLNAIKRWQLAVKYIWKYGLQNPLMGKWAVRKMRQFIDDTVKRL